MPDPTADELAIRNVLARLAQHADEGALDDYLSLMTDDVVWEMPPAGARRGHGEIGAGVRERLAQGVQGPGSDTVHVVTTIVVHVDGDEARGDSTFLFFGAASTEPTVQRMGRYRDDFRRTPGGWKLARRTITFGGPAG